MRSLADRIAALQVELESCLMKSAQTERLRKLGSWEFDLETGALTWSDGTRRVFDVRPDETITTEMALSFYPDASRQLLRTSLDRAVASGVPYDVTVPFNTAEGRTGWLRTIGQVECGGGRRRIVGVVEDITSERAFQDSLRDLAYLDALTGLPNRRSFHDRLAERIAHEKGARACSLLLIDIDDFKAVNDTFGHPVGDDLLKEVAARLTTCIGPSDVVSRIGGDEFALILLDSGEQDAIDRRTQSLHAVLREPVEAGGRTISATASIGTARYPVDGDSAEELLRCADVALYEAKALGRNQSCAFESGLQRKSEARSTVLAGVREALARNELTVFYQPIVDLRTDIVRGLEALVRWDHPTRGLLSPSAFEAALADPVISVAIDDFVLSRSLAQVREWLDHDVPIAAVNVNVSDAQLRRPNLVERVLSLLAQHRLDPGRLKLELVETAFLGRDMDRITSTIDSLAQHGIVCVLDDFGTGHASLTHLRRFRVERLKIDQSFIARICTDGADRGLVKGIIDLGRNLGLRVTAEGVETLEQLSLLRELGCDCAQGYLIGRPIAADCVPAALLSWYAQHEKGERRRRSAAQPLRSAPTA